MNGYFFYKDIDLKGAIIEKNGLYIDSEWIKFTLCKQSCPKKSLKFIILSMYIFIILHFGD